MAPDRPFHPTAVTLLRMLAPPILEIYVLWHPDDVDGQHIANGLLAHFRGTTYSGLLGGAVDVYVRSAGWRTTGGPPRPIACVEKLPNGLPSPQLTVVLPVIGTYLARAVGTDDRWRIYLAELMETARANEHAVGVFPLDIDSIGETSSVLKSILTPTAFLPPWCAFDIHATCRELAHRVASMIGDPLGKQLKIFISHTKRHSPHEPQDDVNRLLKVVRRVICSRTRLAAFFDDTDIPTGSDWYQTLLKEASESALLIVRTDLYAGREWCQREVLVAKESGMPIVTLQAVRTLEERGSFIMDHVPVVPLQGDNKKAWATAVERALDQLVDEALKRALWRHQGRQLRELGFHWLPPSAPEPVTLAPWLRILKEHSEPGDEFLVMHPDPPLGPEEARVIDDLAVLSGFESGAINVVTPRTFSSRGGRPQ